jgi:hypothetical protein
VKINFMYWVKLGGGLAVTNTYINTKISSYAL